MLGENGCGEIVNSNITDYQKMGFKCGLEIHNRLATSHKLFCQCPAHFSKEKPAGMLHRKLRAVAGELGAKDVSAIYEYLRDRNFTYQVFKDVTCLVDTDDEPPHPINKEALEVGLQVAKVLKAEIPDEIHVMRKTVIDGSNTSAFQRTAIIGLNGILETSKGKVRITNISVEEESAGIVETKGEEVVYRLDRLGIPLIEIGTAPDVKDPEHAREVAEKLGMIVRSTGKSQRGVGVTRQDVNVSINGGARVEVKGVQELDSIPQVIENEIHRQIELITNKEQPKPETRTAQADGTTKFTRPLPGGDRLYPETDVPPIVVGKKELDAIKLPEPWDARLQRLKKALPGDLAEQILRSEYLQLYERFSKEVDPVVVANVFASTIKDLRRKGFATENLEDEHFENIFDAFKRGKLAKEAIPVALEKWCENPETPFELLGIGAMTEKELREIVKKVFAAYPQLVREKRMPALMGEVMKAARGKIGGETVAKVLKEMLD